jgi:hypothetical protein
MSRMAIACAFALAALPCSAQEASSARPAATSVTDGRPFLFDGLMKRDGVRQGTQADHRRRRNSGAMVVDPEARQLAPQ